MITGRTTISFRTLDLFHGAGGSSYGAQKAGADIIAGIDLWKTASDTFKINFPKAEVLNEDIRKVDPAALHSKIGDIDLLLASPECTNHSCAKGATKRCEDSKMTAFEVIRFAEEFKPKWIVVENVVHMKSWSRHPELLEALWTLGYYVKEETLNAMDFDVPQNRKRLYLLCSMASETAPIATKGKGLVPASTIIDLKTDYEFTRLYSDNRAKATIERAERAIAELGTSEPFLIVYYGTDGSGGWQSLDEPLRTITTLDRFAYVQPTKRGHMMRMLQPEELKLAMGFSRRYRLQIGTRRDKVKLMGNAVCPPVMENIVRLITSSKQ